MKNNKIAIIVLLFFFCFTAKAQNIAIDSLENKVIQYLKTSNDDVTKKPFLLAKFYSCPSNYIVCIEGNVDKPCRETIAKAGIYKIVSLDEGKTLYFENSFFKNIIIDDKTTSYFTECIATQKKSNLSSSEIIMLLINREFSILNIVKGGKTPDLIENLLCPTDTRSVKRTKANKKHIKLK